MTLYTALVDDAGLFPPTSLHMSDALDRHRRHQEEGSRVLTHRFLCPASRLHRLRSESYTPRRVGVILDTPEPPDLSGLPVDFAETRLPADRRLAELASELLGLLPGGVRLFVEVPPAKYVPDVPEGVALKVRCGGEQPEAFPHVEQLGAFIRFCVAGDIPFKATAGLHHAVRHFDPALGVDRHGFLNLLLAVCEAVEGRDPVTVLRTTDVGELVRMARAVPEQAAKRARQVLVSYGSCSTTTPLDDLRALGLIEEDE